jgi:hypothetical protein
MKEEEKGIEKITAFVIRALYQTQVGWSNQGALDGQGM